MYHIGDTVTVRMKVFEAIDSSEGRVYSLIPEGKPFVALYSVRVPEQAIAKRKEVKGEKE